MANLAGDKDDLKVYIMADFECATGAVYGEQMQPGHYGYEETRRIWMNELNAAIEGAFEEGATNVLVNEGHFKCNNIAPELLDPRAEFITGYFKLGHQLEGLENAKAIFMFTHSMAGAENGVLSHTLAGREIYNIRINGRKIGEFGINAALAGYYDVPVALAVGDTAVEREVTELLGENVICVPIKDGIDRYTARSFSHKKAQALIKEGAKQALRSLGNMKPYKIRPPINLEIEFVGVSMAFFASFIPGVKRVDSRTVSFEHEDFKILHRVLILMINLTKLPLINDPMYG